MHYQSIRRITVCLVGMTVLAAGGWALAADKDLNEPAKPAAKPAAAPDKPPVIIKPTPKLQLKPVTTRHASSQPIKAEKMTMGMVQVRDVISQLKIREELDKQFKELGKEANAAKQDNNQQKMMEIQMKMQKMQNDFRKTLNDAVEFVAQREHIDVVVGETLYKNPSANLPDLTDAVAEHINATASAPASEPASK